MSQKKVRNPKNLSEALEIIKEIQDENTRLTEQIAELNMTQEIMDLVRQPCQCSKTYSNGEVTGTTCKRCKRLYAIENEKLPKITGVYMEKKNGQR